MSCLPKVSVALCLFFISIEAAIRMSNHQGRPKYAFDYTVSDPLTADIKSQWETRDGDLVRGEYSVLDPDGILRTVSYTADSHSGFKAIIKRTKYKPSAYHARHNLF